MFMWMSEDFVLTCTGTFESDTCTGAEIGIESSAAAGIAVVVVDRCESVAVLGTTEAATDGLCVRGNAVVS